MLAFDDFTFTDGLVGGETIQVAEGRWPGVVGMGIGMTVEAFCLVEPHLRAVASGWTADHPYGVFELDACARRELANRLRSEVDRMPNAEAQSGLFSALAIWLEERLDQRKTVSVFGI